MQTVVHFAMSSVPGFMPLKAVLRDCNGQAYWNVKNGKVGVMFIDEQYSLTFQALKVYVDERWWEENLMEPSWDEFRRHECHVFGTSAGCILGLLPQRSAAVSGHDKALFEGLAIPGAQSAKTHVRCRGAWRRAARSAANTAPPTARP